MSYLIQHLSEKTGVSVHVIRMWEKRYDALKPERTKTNRRVYSERDLERLRLLKELNENGKRIGIVASLSNEELVKLVSKINMEELQGDDWVDTAEMELLTPDNFVDCCIDAAKEFDSNKIRKLLSTAMLQFGHRGALVSVIAPFIERVGMDWQHGHLRSGHEHLSTSVIREILMAPVSGYLLSTSAPELVIGTLSGEMHELGALLVMSSARDLGWMVTYLGVNVPVEEIVACVLARNAQAVAISLVYPDSCPVILSKLQKLRLLIPPRVTLILGGRSALSYIDQLPAFGVICTDSLQIFDEELAQLHPKKMSVKRKSNLEI
jgi:DNA-binding transcriptional MerR regulator/methylmalonyl-CoA mutase cobalamin-binding subunit